MNKRDEQSGLVLLVEDNRGISEMVGEFLERRGYSVDYAADGITGLHLAISNSYDVIVLDLMLPGIDGLDVCRKLRQEAKKSTPVLMLTAVRAGVNPSITTTSSGIVESPAELLPNWPSSLLPQHFTVPPNISAHE